jgi:hypothetical protein
VPINKCQQNEAGQTHFRAKVSHLGRARADFAHLLKWPEANRTQKRKADPEKVQIALRLRRESILTSKGLLNDYRWGACIAGGKQAGMTG